MGIDVPQATPRKQVSKRAKSARTATRKASSSSAEELTLPRVRHARSADDPIAPARVRYLVDEFSRTGLAALIGVNRSQTSRWASGEETPGVKAAPILIDLEHVLARARLVWGAEAAREWIESPNVFLEGARPIDVLQIDGPARVLESLDAETWGGGA
ncbi:antitoxin Xre/MbcA/ParS toxin-binding domain-containing protein [Rhodococcus sp. NPDC058521]|uniref:antitoxin Xre/MbcA/ParS toxin-binding domain-containing protein n=1 Tax=Rhodococcus sp. NPDC058521 TaxID=3346536 RepID=UPI003654119F